MSSTQSERSGPPSWTSPRASSTLRGSRTVPGCGVSSKRSDGRMGRPETKARPGYYGEYGGRFAPETLMAPLEELEAAFERWRRDAGFRRELAGQLGSYGGRPTPLTVAPRLSAEAGGAKI